MLKRRVDDSQARGFPYSVRAASRSAVVNTERVVIAMSSRACPGVVLRSMAQMTVSTFAPAWRRATVASLTAPPVVITSSIKVILCPVTSAPSASRRVPYSLVALRTNTAGRPVRLLSMVTRGIPPSSKPPSSWVPGGTSGCIASATWRSNRGLDSKRYLSKYSVAVWPERRAKVPLSRQVRSISAARVSGVSGCTSACSHAGRCGVPKTARSRRTLPLPRVLVDTLTAHRAAQTLEREAAGKDWQDAGLVFTTSCGTMIEPRNLNRFLDEAIARAGLRRVRFHDLRHTCASLLLAQGVSPRVVMEVLGHTQLSMTTDLYGHVLPSSLRSAADAIDGALGA